MNKFKKIILSLFGGINTVFYMFTPIILSSIVVTINNLTDFWGIGIYILGGLATLFRAYKIGWMTK